MNNDRLTSPLRDAEHALLEINMLQIMHQPQDRLKSFLYCLDFVRGLVLAELNLIERNARDAYNLDPTDGNDGERATARNIKRRWMDAA